MAETTQSAAATRDAVQTILEVLIGLDKDEAAKMAGTIDHQTRRACLMIRAAQTRCEREAEAMLTDNPSRDVADAKTILAREMHTLEAHLEEFNKPDRKDEKAPFWAELESAKQAMDEGREAPLEAVQKLLSEVMTRNALYRALKENAMDARDEAAAATETPADDRTHRDCAYSAVMLYKKIRVTQEDMMALLVLKACLLYRLDHVDRSKIEETDKKLVLLMKRRAIEAAVQQTNEQAEKRSGRGFAARLLSRLLRR